MQHQTVNSLAIAFLAACGAMAGLLWLQTTPPQGPSIMIFPDPAHVAVTGARPGEDVVMSGSLGVRRQDCAPQLDRTHAYVIDGDGFGRRVNQWTGVRMRPVTGFRQTEILVEVPKHARPGRGYIGFELTFVCPGHAPRRELSPIYPVEILPAE